MYVVHGKSVSIWDMNIERDRSDEKLLSWEPLRIAKGQAYPWDRDGSVNLLFWLPAPTHCARACNWEGRLDGMEENVLYFHFN